MGLLTLMMPQPSVRAVPEPEAAGRSGRGTGRQAAPMWPGRNRPCERGQVPQPPRLPFASVRNTGVCPPHHHRLPIMDSHEAPDTCQTFPGPVTSPLIGTLRRETGTIPIT